MGRKIIFSLLAALLMASGVFAASDESSDMSAEETAAKKAEKKAAQAAADALLPENMGFTELVAQAEFAVANNEPGLATGYLEEIIARAGGLNDPGARKSVQMARLQLVSACLTLRQWDRARTYAQDYLAGDPVGDRLTALQLLCQVNQSQKKWPELKESAGLILAEKPSLKKQLIAERFMVQALFNLKEYDAALELLPNVMQREKEKAAVRSYQVMQLRCLFEAGRTREVVQMLPEMLRGEARRDVSLNLTLLRMGDRLFDKGKYREALMIYRMVTPKAELEEAVKKEGDLKAEDLQKVLADLRGVPDYDLHIAYRSAQIYSEQKRYWEAVVLFGDLYQNNPKRMEGHAAFLQKVLLLFRVKAPKEAIEEGMAYLKNNRSGIYPRIICTQIAQNYLQKRDFKKVLALEPVVKKWKPAKEKDERDQEAELRYLFGVTRFQLGEYDKAFDTFGRLIEALPESGVAIESRYWQGMCRLLQQSYEPANEKFVHYRETWPNAAFTSAALFRSGVCRFGLEDYEGAKSIFKSFIDEYPEDLLIAEAHSMYADLLGADGELDLALAHYKRAVSIVKQRYAEAEAGLAKTELVIPATYAVLQGAQLIETDATSYLAQGETGNAAAQYRELIEWVESYMDAFGEDADWAKGVFWIGKAQMELGETEKAVKAYLDTLVRFGADPAQEGISSILFDLADIIQTRLSKELVDSTVSSIRAARGAATEQTLQIRLDVLLSELAGSSTALGHELAGDASDLKPIPPSALALICRAYLEGADYSRADELFDYFAKQYENSIFRAPVFELKVRGCIERGELDDAYDLAVEALGMFGATEDTGWAQVMQGRIEVERGEYKQAIDRFNMVFGVRSWRGASCAEAMFRMADAWYRLGNHEKAFAFFQRTYLLYRAYDDGYWAAEAYLRSAETLKTLGRSDAAVRNTYRAMLLDEYVCDLPQAQTAKEVLGPAETAELLAGGTNTLEKINLEEIQ